MDKTISFAKQRVEITDDHLRIIKHCRKSVLFNNNYSWRKKDTDSCFDVTMGSNDGAETCELVGTHILSLLAKVIDHNHSGLYRDDGLILLRNTTGPKMDRIRKDVIKTFKDVGFKIDIKTNLKVVDFLDAKDQTTLYYISIHPRTIHLTSLSSYHHQLQIDSQKIHQT